MDQRFVFHKKKIYIYILTKGSEIFGTKGFYKQTFPWREFLLCGYVILIDELHFAVLVLLRWDFSMSML